MAIEVVVAPAGVPCGDRLVLLFHTLALHVISSKAVCL
jgi:hypothetical protein